MFETILLATDASSNEDAAFSWAQRLAQCHGSKIVVVSVGAASNVSRRIQRQIEQLRERGVPARLAIVADGRDKASVIAHLASASHADLVMVSGAAVPGLAQRIVESSSCPVLALPDPAPVSPRVPVEGGPSRGRS
jgi:nucleotide-binding universal stress UspA family protein